MRIKVLKKSKGFLKVEVDGEGHTFTHLLQDALLADKTVDWAGYDIEHPLFSRPTVTIRIKAEGSPEKPRERAVTKLKSEADDFGQQLHG